MKQEKKKRPYKPPKIRSEKVYERKALACGKSSPRSVSCNANPQSS
jgi:hypothetical protein